MNKLEALQKLNELNKQFNNSDAMKRFLEINDLIEQLEREQKELLKSDSFLFDESTLKLEDKINKEDKRKKEIMSEELQKEIIEHFNKASEILK